MADVQEDQHFPRPSFLPADNDKRVAVQENDEAMEGPVFPEEFMQLKEEAAIQETIASTNLTRTFSPCEWIYLMTWC